MRGDKSRLGQVQIETPHPAVVFPIQGNSWQGYFIIGDAVSLPSLMKEEEVRGGSLWRFM